MQLVALITAVLERSPELSFCGCIGLSQMVVQAHRLYHRDGGEGHDGRCHTLLSSGDSRVDLAVPVGLWWGSPLICVAAGPREVPCCGQGVASE